MIIGSETQDLALAVSIAEGHTHDDNEGFVAPLPLGVFAVVGIGLFAVRRRAPRRRRVDLVGLLTKATEPVACTILWLRRTRRPDPAES